jgi:hypothetical protein
LFLTRKFYYTPSVSKRASQRLSPREDPG